MSFEGQASSMTDKQTSANDSTLAGSSQAGDDTTNSHRGPTQDVKDIRLLGKKQKFMRKFRFYSILGFTSTLMCTWEAVLATSSFSLRDGGRAGLVWTYLGTVIAMTCVVASLADMASMCPVSGGQYHWVSEFAPKRCQKVLSYIVGWVSALGWQAGAASTSYLAGTMIQGLIALWNPTYTIPRWHGSLLTIGVGLLSTFFNTWGAKQLPILEGIVLALHVLGFFGIIIPLWVVAPKTSAKNVFTRFEDHGGWGSVGTACIVGQIGPIFSFIGADAGTHMSEEIRDASKIVPQAMVATAVLNGALGLLAVITYAFCIKDVRTALATSTGYPVIDIFYAATGSKAATTAMIMIIIILLIASGISVLATASRQVFAFAQDDGLPFPHLWRKVSYVGIDVPLNAILLSLSITVLLALVNIGSTAAFNSVVSLLISSLFAGYFISIGCVLLKRLRGEPLPPSRWRMGLLTIPMNAFSLLYIAFALIMSFFPSIKAGLTPRSMNWSVLVLGAVLGFAVGVYVISGRYIYRGPAVYVNRSLDGHPRRTQSSAG